MTGEVFTLGIVCRDRMTAPCSPSEKTSYWRCAGRV